MNTYENIRPYDDSEMRCAMERVLQDRMFPIFVEEVLGEDVNRMTELCRGIRTVDELQVEVVKPMLKRLMERSTGGFTASGFERLVEGKAYMFVSNHRDIVLDAAWLDVALHDATGRLMEITFGSNLMSSEFNVDLGRMNRMFRLERGGGKRELYRHLAEASAYMRHVVAQGRSVWIAQRNGRTKDGDDRTEVALLKMLGMSGEGDVVARLRDLNICPVAVSYEYEPCDFLKIKELYCSRGGKYVKGPNEDARSIKTGMRQWKGRVHFEVTEPVGLAELERCGDGEGYSSVAALIDKRIYGGYRLHKTNYMAYDMLMGKGRFGARYTKGEMDDFVAYRERGLQALGMEAGAMGDLREMFVRMYAMPVVNRLVMNDGQLNE